MNTNTISAITITIAAAVASQALAGGGTNVINFDDMLADNGPGSVNMSQAANKYYYTSQGMTMSASEDLYLGNGVSQGDFGGFLIEGTDGPAFLALYETAVGGTVTLSFGTEVSVMIDLIVSDAGGTDAIIATATATSRGELVETDVIALTSPIGDPDGRSFSYLYHNIDTIQFTLAPNSNRILAFDNIRWNQTGCGIADINGDGFLDFFDISDYLLLYSNGCPE